MSYSRELIDDLLKSSDIVSVISSYIPVIQKGRSYLAVCPFHDDKNPSLNISKEKQIYKCFACGEGGNALTFVSKFEKISFDEAVRKLASIVGFNDPRLLSEHHEKKVNTDLVPLYKCINDLQLFYQYGLSTEEGKSGKEYLAKRNIDDEVANAFGIGYSLLDGKKTVQYLQAKGHSLKSIEDIGIALAKANGTSDSNAGRLVFPLKDADGQVVGFSARRIRDDGTAKYVNSPETRIFHKSEVLYNYNQAKETARHDGYIYVLEGFMDVIALWKAGIKSAVAVMGTNLSDQHIKMLRRLNAEVRLCLDGDDAGQTGMMKMIPKLYKANIPFRIVLNPNDLRDPDDIYQESGADALKEMMNHLVDPFDFQMNYYLNVKKLSSKEDREKVLRYFIPYLASIPAGLDRENNIAKLSRITGYESEVIRSQISQTPEKAAKEESIVPSVSKARIKIDNRGALDAAERLMLYYMLHEREAVEYFRTYIDAFYNTTYDTIANFIVEYENKRNTNIEISLLLSDIEQKGLDNTEELTALATALSDDTSYPPFSLEQAEACAKRIRSEKDKKYEKESLKKELIGKTPEEKADIMNKALEKKRQKFAKKGNGE